MEETPTEVPPRAQPGLPVFSRGPGGGTGGPIARTGRTEAWRGSGSRTGLSPTVPRLAAPSRLRLPGAQLQGALRPRRRGPGPGAVPAGTGCPGPRWGGACPSVPVVCCPCSVLTSVMRHQTRARHLPRRLRRGPSPANGEEPSGRACSSTACPRPPAPAHKAAAVTVPRSQPRPPAVRPANPRRQAAGSDDRGRGHRPASGSPLLTQTRSTALHGRARPPRRPG